MRLLLPAGFAGKQIQKTTAAVTSRGNKAGTRFDFMVASEPIKQQFEMH
jgi:hypothetical protein